MAKTDFEIPNHLRHQARLEACQWTQKLEESRAKAKYADHPLVDELNARRLMRRHLENEIDIAKFEARKETEALWDSFRVRWWVWRTILPIARIVGEHPGDILSRSRKMRYVIPRHTCIWMVRTLSEISFPQIAQALGKDHSTLMAAHRVVEEALATGDPTNPFCSIVQDVLDLEADAWT